MLFLANVARRGRCRRLEWSVLDWNESAIRFYLSLGAKPVSGWTKYRLDSEAIEALAAAHPPEDGQLQALSALSAFNNSTTTNLNRYAKLPRELNKVTRFFQGLCGCRP